MIGLGLSLWPRATGGGDPDALAYFAAMSVQPDDTRKGLLNDLIVALKDDGLWSKLDWLQLLAAHDAQAGRINLRNPSQVAVAVNSPAFTADRGFAGDGATSYLNTGWNPTTASSPKFAQNDAHMGLWVGTNVSAAGQVDIGNSSSCAIISRNGASLQVAANSLTTSTLSGIATSVGHSLWARDGATTGAGYRDGVLLGTISTTSNAPANAPILIGCRNGSTNGGATPVAHSTRRIAAAHWGSTLDATDAAALYAILSAYMTAIGAP